MKKVVEEPAIHQKYQKEIFEQLQQEPFAHFLGITLLEVGPGSAKAELLVKDHMLNSHSTAHGAVIFALADYVFAAASNSYGRTAVGLSNTINYMAPGLSGKTMTASATEVRRNNKIAWYTIQVECEGALLASMEAHVFRKEHYFVPVE